ncbi:hypothetical protein N7491_006858 [Penicillium cf. griseofulvum]|uniref:Uncharacterized protein n=1 Tax=Penicillium cf. griseofulvum TaxID=2972120 RepID=A0A9W9IXD0_9EURO|nr:hypothetical protein N7472_010111 [Penicillium cf. griseofulvum]KAJ5429842.1 hypothetical protein N7491_006858 [Penicillium cf. griseofulvum]KAJ5436388.1 hypothetical protein N7445_007273 [Penicillium cf. griseofulvum]
MKFTGLTISLVLAGFGYSAALPSLANVGGPVSDIGGAVGGVTGVAAKFVAPVTSTTGGLTGGLTGVLKRDSTAALDETVKTIPSLANSAVSLAGSAVGTGGSIVSGAAGTAENAIVRASSSPKRQLNDLVGIPFGSAVPSIIHEAKAVDLTGAVGTAEHVVAGASPAAKRQLNDLVGSTLGGAIPAIPAIIQEGKPGGLAGILKRDGTAALGETIETIPKLANSGIAIAGNAVGAGESLISGAASTAKNAVGQT